MSLMPVVEAWGLASTLVEMVQAFSRQAGNTYNNPYAASMPASAVGQRTTVSRPGDTPDTYGAGSNPAPINGVPAGGYVDANGDSEGQGFTNAATGEHGATLDSTPGNPTLFDEWSAWLANVAPRVGTFAIGAVVIVLALFLLTRGQPATPVVVVNRAGKGNSNGGAASSGASNS